MLLHKLLGEFARLARLRLSALAAEPRTAEAAFGMQSTGPVATALTLCRRNLHTQIVEATSPCRRYFCTPFGRDKMGRPLTDSQSSKTGIEQLLTDAVAASGWRCSGPGNGPDIAVA